MGGGDQGFGRGLVEALGLGVERHAQLEAALGAETQGLDQAAAESLVAAAHQVCPYSNAIRGNVDVAISVRAE